MAEFEHWEGKPPLRYFGAGVTKPRSPVPVSPVKTLNLVEQVMVDSVMAGSTAPFIAEQMPSLPVVVPPETQVLMAGLPVISMVAWIFRWLGLSWLLEKLGLPTPVKDLLRMSGETLGLDQVFGRFGGIFGDRNVAVYYRGALLGVMVLKAWIEFRQSMRRSVRDRFRIRY